LLATGAAVTAVVCDVSDAEQVVALRDAAVAAYGAVHVLCNNAGVASGGSTWRTKPAVWDWVVGVDLLGVAYGVHAFTPLMIEQGEGHIVNTASEAGVCATPMLGAYHAAKYGVVGLSEALVMELAGTGVGVSCLCPELVRTKIFESTRNAPSHLGLRKPESVSMEMLESVMQTTALDPAIVAGNVTDAIVEGRFWVFTHASTQTRVAHRNDRQQQGIAPEMLPMGVK
jgi:NAD(P)-dependent dehydrogenase (short-subunit alcohol dehydrogenase family)